jgi:hypothetical protein
MRMALIFIAASALIGGAAQAHDDPAAATPTKAVAADEHAEATKVLYVCSEEERNWRAFSRDLGTPEFVTAKRVIADQGKAWSEPKCITQSELKRLASMTSPAK